jgi:adenylate cyclase
MITHINAARNQLEALLASEIAAWKSDASFDQAYQKQRQQFIVNRLQLQAKIMLAVGVTLMMFFFWVNPDLESKIQSLKIGLLTELFIVICWVVLCKTTFGRRYCDLILLCLSWAVTCSIQIDTAILFKHFEPFFNIWYLMFLTQATIVPVKWRLHLISHLGTVVCYGCIFLIYRPQLQQPLSFYVENSLYLFWTIIICCFSVYLYEKLRKKEFRATQELKIAQQQSEKLLLNILPEMIVAQLKEEPTTIADIFQEVSVLFADIVGFTELSTRVSPPKLVELLNEIFCLFDELAERHGVEKIKTIGDAYMAVAGLPNHRGDHAIAIANMALDMQKAVAEFNAVKNQTFCIRIGISTGPVVAGVIGLKKFAYDLWGDTVNTASRMESHGIAGSIQVCQASYELLKDKYILEKRGLIQVKGKGEMMTYLLHGIKM